MKPNVPFEITQEGIKLHGVHKPANELHAVDDALTLIFGL
jgi:hypothetical protein